MMTMEGREKAKAVLSLGDDRRDCQDLRVKAAIMDDKEFHDVRRMEPVIRAGLLDQLLAGSDAATARDHGRLRDSLNKALAERAINAEIDHHLGEEAQAENSRNVIGSEAVR